MVTNVISSMNSKQHNLYVLIFVWKYVEKSINFIDQAQKKTMMSCVNFLLKWMNWKKVVLQLPQDPKRRNQNWEVRIQLENK